MLKSHAVLRANVTIVARKLDQAGCSARFESPVERAAKRDRRRQKETSRKSGDMPKQGLIN